MIRGTKGLLGPEVIKNNLDEGRIKAVPKAATRGSAKGLFVATKEKGRQLNCPTRIDL